jgi:hypothetical protein
MNSRAFSWALSGRDLHSDGKVGVPPSVRTLSWSEPDEADETCTPV